MDLIARRVIEKLEGGSVTEEILQEYADPESEKYEQMLEEIRCQLNFTSLRYNRLDDMIESTGLPAEKLCTYCWNGKE
jgi:amidophosphoribosyltransferase